MLELLKRLVHRGRQREPYEKKLFAALISRRNSGPTPDRDTDRFLEFCLNHHRESKAQLFQDLLVLFLLGEKRAGYFVEFGATDGKTLSNSYLLESAYDWRGIVAEPARVWSNRLKENRGCSIDYRCVWERSGETIGFSETKRATLSTITKFSRVDRHARARKGAARYEVQTVSLADLLNDHNAPHDIDYMSVDTEGSEFRILNGFDFNSRNVRILSIEHNQTRMRGDIFSLMTRHGYRRIFEPLSSFDDWYVRL